MNVFERLFNFGKELLVSAIRLSTRFTNVEVMNLTIKNVLIAFSYLGKIDLLDDVELLERLDVSVDRRAIYALELLVQEVLNFLNGNLPRLVVQNEL